MSSIILLGTLFTLAVILLTSLKGAAFLEDPNPEISEHQQRRLVLAELNDIRRHRPHHIVSTADSEAERC